MNNKFLIIIFSIIFINSINYIFADAQNNTNIQPSNSINQVLNDVGQQIDIINKSLDKSHKDNLNDAILYSDNAIIKSKQILININKQQSINTNQINNIKLSILKLENAINMSKWHTNIILNSIYQQIIEINTKHQNTIIVEDNHETQANIYLVALLKIEHDKLIILQNNINTLHDITQKLHNQINKLNTKLIAYQKYQHAVIEH